MKKLILLVPFLALSLVACSSQTPEEKEAAKYGSVQPLAEADQAKIKQEQEQRSLGPAGGFEKPR